MQTIKILLLLLMWLPLPVFANQPIQLGAHLAVVGNDGPSGSDFDESTRAEGFVLLPVAPNLSLEAGLAKTTKTESSDTDNTGSYQLEISSSDVFIGARLETATTSTINFFARGGVLYYYSEIDFSESFFDLKPSGSIEAVEEGTGYYLGAGASLRVNEQLKIEAELTHRNRKDYFEDSTNPFDMKSLGLAVGVVFTLQ